MEFRTIIFVFKKLLGKADNPRKPVATDFSWAPSEIRVMEVLNHVDCRNPRLRQQNRYDRKFIKFVPYYHKYDAALFYLNRYGYLCDTYFEHLTDAENNPYLQLQICSVQRFSCGKSWYAKYPNLICAYLAKWDFLPEVKEKIFSDEKYEDVRSIYCRMEKR